MSQGHVLIRMPISMHQQLLALAKQNGVSLNQLCVALLASGIHFKLEQEEP